MLPALTAGTAVRAHAARKADTQPGPPGAMSTIGGAALGRAGTQVNPAPGIPALPREVTGRSWIVADAGTGDVLASHNAHWRLPPASTLKMLFADTVLPRLPRTQSRLVRPADLAQIGEGSSLVGVMGQQTYTVHDLWLGVFLRSGNDAVHVLAEMNGGIAKTVRDMNARAAQLQAFDTRVISPDGYDAEGQVSSAYDLTLIARSGLQNKDFREYCATARAQFPGKPVPGGGKRPTFEIANTNRLLTGDAGITPYKGITGVKNGSTTHAGSTFTGAAERNGKMLLVTVMNPSSGERYAVYKEAARLLDWGFAAAGKVKPVGELVPPKPAGASPQAVQHRAGADGPGHAPVTASYSGTGIALGAAAAVLLLAAGVRLRRSRSQSRP
ncbi:D-alanyl-D-alanine carboxypeptidase family protein [Streptomyces sp. NPDC008121]|uniref:D-alanyl-D-alanine carboxypeptidase family protein n=1 Tax=Streptomyces sp. NPDC008121 TaxID=3364809 RepID=UPI0036EDEAD5